MGSHEAMLQPAGAMQDRCFQGNAAFSCHRTLTQEDPGDNQITLEEVVQMVNPFPSVSPPGSSAWRWRNS